MHKIKIHIVDAQRLQRTVKALVDALMPRIIEFRRDPDLISWDARILDAKPDFLLVFVCQCGVNVPVAFLKSNFDGFADLAWRTLPCSYLSYKSMIRLKIGNT